MDLNKLITQIDALKVDTYENIENIWEILDQIDQCIKAWTLTLNQIPSTLSAFHRWLLTNPYWKWFVEKTYSDLETLWTKVHKIISKLEWNWKLKLFESYKGISWKFILLNAGAWDIVMTVPTIDTYRHLSGDPMFDDWTARSHTDDLIWAEYVTINSQACRQNTVWENDTSSNIPTWPLQSDMLTKPKDSAKKNYFWQMMDNLKSQYGTDAWLVSTTDFASMVEYIRSLDSALTQEDSFFVLMCILHIPWDILLASWDYVSHNACFFNPDSCRLGRINMKDAYLILLLRLGHNPSTLT